MTGMYYHVLYHSHLSLHRVLTCQVLLLLQEPMVSPSSSSTWITSLPPIISVGTKAYTLSALAVFDASKLPSTKSIGEDCLKQIQDLQIAHWGTEHVEILPEDTIQALIMGANRLLDFLLSME